MDDGLGDRVWVDRVDCRAFVENIQTAFGTRLPSVSMLASETTGKPESACKSEYIRFNAGFRRQIHTVSIPLSFIRQHLSLDDCSEV